MLLLVLVVLVLVLLINNLTRQRPSKHHRASLRNLPNGHISDVFERSISETYFSDLFQRPGNPADFGFGAATLEELVGGDAAENAITLEAVLAGTIKGGKRDIAVLNAAAGFVITGTVPDLEAGKALAEDLLVRGAAHAKLRAMQDLC